MKLLNKITLNYFKNTAIVFFFALGILYLVIDQIIISEVNEQLRKTNREVREKLESGIIVDYHPFVEISEVNLIPAEYDKYDDVEISYNGKKGEEIFRQYVAYTNINGKNYKIITRSSLIEKEDLFWTILLLMSSILVILLIVLFYANRKAAKNIFKPFYENLKILDSFTLQNNNEFVLEKSNISEFERLNDSLLELSKKAKKEYNLLKEFTEDLSHELQTPVSIIKTKLELIIQKEINDSETEDNYQAIYQNINKLDRLNRTLLLLTKLESPDFFPSRTISVKAALQKAVDVYSDAAESENIKISLLLNSEITVEMNETLIETLLNNLFSNSIKHNYQNGEVIVELDENKLIVKNTGETPVNNPENYFNRFTRSYKSKDSTGLGLSVVKKICDLYGMKISYTFEKSHHTVIIIF